MTWKRNAASRSWRRTAPSSTKARTSTLSIPPDTPISAARSSACCRWWKACCCWSMRWKVRCRRPVLSRARRWPSDSSPSSWSTRWIARAIHLVDHDDGLESEGQRLARDKTGLRHRTFHRIDQQQHAFHHRQHALDLAAEIGVSGGIDNVDVRAFVLDGAVLRQDRDAAFLFQVIGVHDPLCDMLMRRKRAGLAQKFVDQRGLAVVDVGNNGDVANVACHGKQCGEKGRAVYHGKGCNSLNFRIMLLPTRDAQKNGPNRVLYPTK